MKITEPMRKAGMEVLQAEMTGAEVHEIRAFADEIVEKIFVAMRAAQDPAAADKLDWPLLAVDVLRLCLVSALNEMAEEIGSRSKDAVRQEDAIGMVRRIYDDARKAMPAPPTVETVTPPAVYADAFSSDLRASLRAFRASAKAHGFKITPAIADEVATRFKRALTAVGAEK